ncbi:haloacid dehalogenase-like family hydrolase [Listeria floridensis FSL S10-1187]|uniref:Haloacid dehalogenase-like family hydrolase n=1 Tax=Listeria floridensis FSL S10-1187 TaxID=1265817 RepID=A0ABN0REN0_9LIST|nr:HAD family hydrolase [Listeria floridensis]EUJ31277.1 haloacid dehalogenase-like family hydrolase [Listeria floridensis FSL S10-1187]
MEKHLICSDLDGTLLRKDHTISRKNQQMIRDLIDAGHYFSVATGRLFNMARYFAETVSDKAGVIASNGSIAIAGDGKEIYKVQMKPEALLDVYRVCRDENVLVSFFSEDTVFSNRERKLASYDSDAKARVAAPKHVVVDREADFRRVAPLIVNGIVIEDHDFEHLRAVREQLETISGVACLSSNTNNIELLAEGYDKRVAVKQLAAYLDVKLENVIVFGDGENDIGMLDLAGTGVAMQNASELVKEHADFVTKSNERDGVYHFLKGYFYK